MAKVVCVLYDDPVDGYPSTYPRDDLPHLDHYPGGQTLPTPSAIDFTPGTLLGSVSGELGLRPYLEGLGHELIVTSDKDGENSEFDRHLADAEIVISQPFWPAYLTAERIARAPQAQARVDRGDRIRPRRPGRRHQGRYHGRRSDLLQQHQRRRARRDDDSVPGPQLPARLMSGSPEGGWNIADCVQRSYDLEGMQVGTVAAGRIGLAVMRRLAPFDVHLHYTDKHRLPAEVEAELNATYHPTVQEMVPHLDVVTINAPLHPETRGLFNDELISTMKRGAYLINTARALICDRDAVVRALESGQLAGYAGDVWYPQPAPADHPWRTMPYQGMTPHISGTSLSAQARYAAGTREILECYFSGRPIRDEYLIVDGGALAGAGAHSYTAGG